MIRQHLVFPAIHGGAWHVFVGTPMCGCHEAQRGKAVETLEHPTADAVRARVGGQYFYLTDRLPELMVRVAD